MDEGRSRDCARLSFTSYFVTVFTAALFMALVGRYGLHLY
jgi:hypothetical protein